MTIPTQDAQSGGNGASAHKPFWRQPLVHFLLGAIAIFVFNAFRGAPPAPDAQTIIVTSSQIERLSAGWAKSWQRPPDEEELKNLVSDYVAQEVYNRQARALRLDEGDPVIRRYLRQKMELLTTGSLIVPEPTGAELRSYFEQHATDYKSDACFDFRQVSIRGLGSDQISRLRSSLQAGKLPDTDPDRRGLPDRMTAACKTDVSRIFGVTFYDALAGLETGVWQGPVASPNGDYLVFVEQRQDGTVPSLGAIHERVRADWHAARRQQLEKASFERLKSLYDIQVEWPGP